jgi:hypothetical protein
MRAFCHSFLSQEMEHERDMALAQIHEEERLDRVHKRQHGAVPIVVHGARFHRVNGCYEPVDEVTAISSLSTFLSVLLSDPPPQDPSRLACLQSPWRS